MKKIARIEHLKRVDNSVNGNPTYIVTFTDGTMYRTAPDASCAYGIQNPEMQGDLIATIENNKISYLEPVTKEQ